MNSTKYWIALDRVQGIGPASLKEIYKKISDAGLSISDIFDISPEELKSEFYFNDKIASAFKSAAVFLSSVEEEYMQLIDAGIDVLPFFSKSYPERLHHILGNNIPPFLYLYGSSGVLNEKGAAIIGESKISSRGEFIAYSAARELASRNINVISGFANGADLTAHRAALEHGGITTAFVPYGILKLNIPESIRHVYDPSRMAAVSIFSPGHTPDMYAAYIRNRVICALASAVFIVESPDEGGIFEAAKSAHALNIPLYTTEYAEYPPTASGNKRIMSEFGALPVRGKKVDSLTLPNMDRIIADVKFK
ncbi:MAG TPA: DNA-processing protein DprA [Spirochaetota bacterium]|nr:DNA-processing protein DprA [Spirochaetota bacterium]HPF05049.1 DNA-processing protein DprA [Spirochaetota bacterium]HPJ41174.1 DNA-processing protein DprA [Spirochaetota bacterium]HPR38171.1 DNA-processing protein DprA [Spirochaetota bacterium]HRX47586.1 DNA-processing protein DprA [Spirochaetota bacterium]